LEKPGGKICEIFPRILPFFCFECGGGGEPVGCVIVLA
jgi:hypothetical protein